MSPLRAQDFTLWEENEVARAGIAISLLQGKLRYSSNVAHSDYRVSTDADFHRAARDSLARAGASAIELGPDKWDDRRSSVFLDRPSLRQFGAHPLGAGNSMWQLVEYDSAHSPNRLVSFHALYSHTDPTFWSLAPGGQWWDGMQGSIFEVGSALTSGAARLEWAYNSHAEDTYSIDEFRSSLAIGVTKLEFTKGVSTTGDTNSSDPWTTKERYSSYGVEIRLADLLAPAIRKRWLGGLSWALPDKVRVRNLVQGYHFPAPTGSLSSILRIDPEQLRNTKSLGLSWSGDHSTTDIFVTGHHKKSLNFGQRQGVGESRGIDFSRSLSGDTWDTAFDASFGENVGIKPGAESKDLYYSLGVSGSLSQNDWPRLSLGIEYDRYNLNEIATRDVYWDEAWNLDLKADFSRYLPKTLSTRRSFLNLRYHLRTGSSFDTGGASEASTEHSLMIAFGISF
jgi:hypothetical protein